MEKLLSTARRKSWLLDYIRGTQESPRSLRPPGNRKRKERNGLSQPAQERKDLIEREGFLIGAKVKLKGYSARDSWNIKVIHSITSDYMVNLDNTDGTFWRTVSPRKIELVLASEYQRE